MSDSKYNTWSREDFAILSEQARASTQNVIDAMRVMVDNLISAEEAIKNILEASDEIRKRRGDSQQQDHQVGGLYVEEQENRQTGDVPSTGMPGSPVHDGGGGLSTESDEN